MSKIKSKSQLSKILQNLRKNKKKISLCHGVFDVVHYGHILHFKSAKEIADILIVSVTKDKFIKKGFNRPLFAELERLKFLNEINTIDYIYCCETESAENSINLIKPNFYIKGPDYKNNSDDATKKIYLEKNLVKKFGGQIKYTDDQKYSSSKIINKKNLLSMNSDQLEYIENIKNKFGYKYIKEEILKFKKTSILVIGELIIDHYFFGDIIGKSGKEPHLVLKEDKDEMYLGGSGAIARHLSAFSEKVEVISPFGKEKTYKKIFNEKLTKNIFYNFLKPYKNYPTIVKKRFIDKNSNYKFLGSYILPEKNEIDFSKNLISKIKRSLNNADMILICDYGHYFIDKRTSKFLSLTKKFKALNVQINAASSGYHNLNNYKYIDLLVINESELRRELKEEKLNLKNLASIVISKNKIKNLIITQGKLGASLYRIGAKPIFCPAFSKQAIDKVGAGDAMLSISSLALRNKVNPEIALFLGSVAAGISVNTIGNKTSLNFDDFDRNIEFTLM
jgi:rfaE bifunctional protein kinase chain/domain/rfaE bifunctional protein nucleotidyltransferase chain/domain